MLQIGVAPEHVPQTLTQAPLLHRNPLGHWLLLRHATQWPRVGSQNGVDPEQVAPHGLTVTQVLFVQTWPDGPWVLPTH